MSLLYLIPVAVWAYLLLRALNWITQHYVAFAWSRATEPTRVQSHVDAGEYDKEWKGKRERARPDFHRFFVQNLEEVPLEGPSTLEIRIQSEIASFKFPPRVFAGPTPLRYELDKNEKRRWFKLKFDSLPPHATWVLEWQLDHESDVEVILSPTGARTPSFLVGENGIIQVAAVVIPSTAKEGRKGWSSTPRPRALAFCLCMAVGGYWALQSLARGYATTLLAESDRGTIFGWMLHFSFADLIAVCVIMLAVVTLYWLCRKQPMPIVQGYWQPTRLEAKPAEQKSGDVGSLPAANSASAPRPSSQRSLAGTNEGALRQEPPAK